MAELHDEIAESTGYRLVWVSDGGSSGPFSWTAYAEEAGWVRCTEHGIDYELRPGEQFRKDDPRLCEHGRSFLA